MINIRNLRFKGKTMEKDIIQQLMENKVIAIVRDIPYELILPLAQAILSGGIRFMEVTFDHGSKSHIKETARKIEHLVVNMGNKMEIGAGTVLSPKEAEMAVSAGAAYIISPDTNRNVIEKTKKLGACAIPGALTPTEIALAYAYGADFVKVFPVCSLGPAYIKDIRKPLSHIPLLAVGDVNADNIADYLAAGASGAGVGGNLVSVKLALAGNFDQIAAEAKRYADAISKV